MPSASKVKTKSALRDYIIAALILVVCLVVFFVTYFEQSTRVIVDGRSFRVKIADEPDERSLGLSGTSALDNDEGMLFVFEESDRHGFWMKDMNYSIDILWIDDNLTVIHVEENVSPSSYPEVFYPNTNARYVLEIYTGQAAAQGLGIGDRVSLEI